MKNKILQALTEAGLYSISFREAVANKAMGMVSGKVIDQKKFDSWLKSLNFSGQNIRAYFLHQLEIALSNKTFDVSAPQSVASDPETDEKVLAEAKEWESLVCDNPDEHCGCGVRYFDRKGNLRGHFDGKGGFVFVDGRHYEL